MKNEPLTEEQILVLGENAFDEIIIINGDKAVVDIPQFSITLARAVEQAHGIGDRH